MDSHTLQQDALKFLSDPERVTAVIGSSLPDGDVHAATVYYSVDEDFNFFFLTATNTQKYKNLLTNPNAAIVVGFGPSYTTVQGRGVTELLEKGSEAENHAIALIKKRLLDHNNETWPIFQMDTYDQESIAVFRFTPNTLQLLNLEQNSGLTTTGDTPLQVV